jgi:hypothetical protein
VHSVGSTEDRYYWDQQTVVYKHAVGGELVAAVEELVNSFAGRLPASVHTAVVVAGQLEDIVVEDSAAVVQQLEN